MANQTLQLVRLLDAEGVAVTLVPVNPPYRPAWIRKIRVLRALFRLFSYIFQLWREARSTQVFHIMANSGWAWFLFATPAIIVARLQKKACVVNYRGGEAASFLERSNTWVRPVMQLATTVIVPSAYLASVFSKYNVATEIVPNVIDLERFSPPASPCTSKIPTLVVARNLEPIYDNATAIRAFAAVRTQHPSARLYVAGTGSERTGLQALVHSLSLGDAVRFTGRLSPQEMRELYHRSVLMLNPSTVDNMPNSILEALASGLPVVSTNVGGVPYLVQDGRTALLVPARDDVAMANAALRLLTDGTLRDKLRSAGRTEAARYSWIKIRPLLLKVYWQSTVRAKRSPKTAVQ
jgi:glycosyltransferase involved in cell wall biosynthesis